MTFIVFAQRDTQELEAIFVILWFSPQLYFFHGITKAKKICDFLPSYIFFMELLKQKKKKKKSIFQMLTLNQIPSSRELFHICS